MPGRLNGYAQADSDSAVQSLPRAGIFCRPWYGYQFQGEQLPAADFPSIPPKCRGLQATFTIHFRVRSVAFQTNRRRRASASLPPRCHGPTAPSACFKRRSDPLPGPDLSFTRTVSGRFPLRFGEMSRASSDVQIHFQARTVAFQTNRLRRVSPSLPPRCRTNRSRPAIKRRVRPQPHASRQSSLGSRLSPPAELLNLRCRAVP